MDNTTTRATLGTRKKKKTNTTHKTKKMSNTDPITIQGEQRWQQRNLYINSNALLLDKVNEEGESVLVYVLKGDYVLLFTCLHTGHGKCSRFSYLL